MGKLLLLLGRNRGMNSRAFGIGGKVRGQVPGLPEHPEDNNRLGTAGAE